MTQRRLDLAQEISLSAVAARWVGLPSGMIDQLTITWVVDRLHRRDPRCKARLMLFDVLEQFRFCVGRAGYQDHTGIGNRLSHPLEKVVIFGGMSATDAIGFVMQVPSWIIRMHDKLVGVRRVEMEHAGFAMIDPNHGMMMC